MSKKSRFRIRNKYDKNVANVNESKDNIIDNKLSGIIYTASHDSINLSKYNSFNDKVNIIIDSCLYNNFHIYVDDVYSFNTEKICFKTNLQIDEYLIRSNFVFFLKDYNISKIAVFLYNCTQFELNNSDETNLIQRRFAFFENDHVHRNITKIFNNEIIGKKYNIEEIEEILEDKLEENTLEEIKSLIKTNTRLFSKDSKHIERMIKDDISIVGFYLKYISNGGRRYILEETISKSAELSAFYAFNIIKGRFPEGEKIIATNLKLTMEYLSRILKYERWTEGEKIIATCPESSLIYAKKVIKGSWPEGESAIATSAKCAFLYAKNIKRDRLLIAEDLISKDEKFKDLYYKYMLKCKK